MARKLEVGALATILNFSCEQGRIRPDMDVVALHDEGLATFYGWVPSQRSGSAAVHAIAHRHGLTAYGVDYSDGQDGPIPILDPHKLALDLETLVRMKERAYTLIVLVWAAHTHLIARFQSTFYLGFQGKTGSGKGTGIETCIFLTPNGIVLSDATDAYLASILNEGRAIGLVEWDSLVRKNPGIEALLRNGYRRGASRGIMVQKGDGKKWEEATLSLFGPKVFDTHAGPSSHLLGRSIVIPMEADNSVDRALDAEEKADRLRPLRSTLSRGAGRALADWTHERVVDHVRSPEFRTRVAAMGGRTGRDHVIAALVLLTCDMMGWNLAVELRPILSGRTTIEEFGLETEVLEAIRGLVGEIPPDGELVTDRLLGEINRRRHDTGVTARLTAKGLGGALRELGFRRGPEWERAKAGPNRDSTIVRPHRILREWSERSSPTDPACPSCPSGPSPQDEAGTMGSLGMQNDAAAPLSGGSLTFDPEDLFAGSSTRADRARTLNESRRTEPPSEVDRAVALLGPSITYGDGRVTDRRTGDVIAYPIDWPRIHPEVSVPQETP